MAPTLESGLRDQRLDALERAARRQGAPIRAALDDSVSQRRLDRVVRRAADASGARVTLLAVTRSPEGPRTEVRSDSTADVELGLGFEVATEAARTGQVARATEAAAGGRVAQAALPLRFRPPGARRAVVAYVITLSQPLAEVGASVTLIRRRILIAGAIALALAVLAGYVVARRVSGRIERMDHAARRVARGDFSARFERGARDELGQLAHTLDDEELDDDTRRAFVRQLREQVARLGKLATDLLDLSKLEAGSLQLRPEPTDVGLLARSVADEFAPALATHESHLELRLGADPVEAVCDPERVAQIMRILLDNALRHTPAGTDVVLAAGRRDGRLRLSVTDFGTGVKRTAMPRIFEPFFTSDDAQGSGLGLAIARELAERMDGRLSVDSAPGRTTFALELPA